jgi:hypothetical protein
MTTLSPARDPTVSVQYATADGAAQAGAGDVERAGGFAERGVDPSNARARFPDGG